MFQKRASASCLFIIVLAVSFLASTGPSAFAEESYAFVKKWGTLGNYDGMLNVPASLALDSAGNVYVADTNNNRVEKFSGDGKFLAKWGTYGRGDGQFNLPTSIVVDSQGYVYVADQSNNRIEEFNSSGTYVKEFDLSPYYPARIAIGPDGNLFLTDPTKSLVVKFSTGGQTLAKWGALGDGDGQFDTPTGIAVDQSGNVFVVDSGNNRVQEFSRDGRFLAKWGSEGNGDGKFSGPQGITVDSNGDVYVTDTQNGRVEKFTSTGQFITAFGSPGSGDGKFGSPSGVAVGPSGAVYVTDASYDNPTVQEFAPSSASSAPPGSTVPEFGEISVIALAASFMAVVFFTRLATIRR